MLTYFINVYRLFTLYVPVFCARRALPSPAPAGDGTGPHRRGRGGCTLDRHPGQGARWCARERHAGRSGGRTRGALCPYASAIPGGVTLCGAGARRCRGAIYPLARARISAGARSPPRPVCPGMALLLHTRARRHAPIILGKFSAYLRIFPLLFHARVLQCC